MRTYNLFDGRYAAMRKLNDFIKRARQAKIHAFIIANLKDDMPKLFGKGRKKKELIKNLPALLKKIQVKDRKDLTFYLCSFVIFIMIGRRSTLLQTQTFRNCQNFKKNSTRQISRNSLR